MSRHIDYSTPDTPTRHEDLVSEAGIHGLPGEDYERGECEMTDTQRLRWWAWRRLNEKTLNDHWTNFADLKDR